MSAVVRRALFGGWVAACVLLVLFPLYLLFMVSVAPGAAIFGERPALWVSEPTLRFWARVVERGDLWAPLAKSLVVACATERPSWVSVAPTVCETSRNPPAPSLSQTRFC